jgi:DivIVA domain-containing protein
VNSPEKDPFGPTDGPGADEFALKPEDVSTAEFRRVSVGGYAREDVDQFAEKCADHIARLQRQVRYLKDTVEEQSKRIAELTQRDRASMEAELDALEARRDAYRREMERLLDRHRQLLDDIAANEQPAETAPAQVEETEDKAAEAVKPPSPKAKAHAQLRRKRRRKSARGPF